MHYLEDMVESLGFLPAEMKKKCVELRELDFQYKAKMEKLGVDSEQFFTTMPTLTTAESEKQNKELEQRYNEARLIANSKIHITEYLQKVLEKYNEKVVKDLTDFKAELEIENPGEVDLIEKAFLQSITNPNNNLKNNLIFFNENSSEILKNIQQIDEQQFSPSSGKMTTAHLNGNDIVDVTPKNVNIQRVKQQQQTSTYEDFKIPSNFRRPSQSVDVRGSKTTTSTTGRLIDDDIFDNEMASSSSPPVKKHKISAPSFRQIGASSYHNDTANNSSSVAAVAKRSRECSPRSSISSISPRSTSPSTSTILPLALSKFQFPPSRMASMERWNASFKQSSSTNLTEQLATTSTMTTNQAQQQSAAALLRMPSFAGAQPSRHGRTRKLTKRVVQMLNESMPKPPEHGTTSSNTIIRHNNHQNERIIRRKQQQRKGGKDDNRGGENTIMEEDEEHLEDYEGEEEILDEEGEDETDDKAWCYCKQGSAGNMVACDSKNCPYEWFHYECVGITQPPKGQWYCPTCSMKLSSAMRSRSASTEQQQR